MGAVVAMGGSFGSGSITTLCPLCIVINSFPFLQMTRKFHQANSKSHLLTDPNRLIHHTRREILIKRGKSRNRKCRCKLINLDFCFIFWLFSDIYRLTCQFGQFWRIVCTKLNYHSETYLLIEYDDRWYRLLSHMTNVKFKGLFYVLIE